MPHFCCSACGHTCNTLFKCPDSEQSPNSNAATGFDLSPLPNSDVLIHFQSDDGTILNTQVVTREVLCRPPVVVHAFFLAVNQGEEAARDFLSRFKGGENTDLLSGGDR